jgi:hypothetical protein
MPPVPETFGIRQMRGKFLLPFADAAGRDASPDLVFAGRFQQDSVGPQHGAWPDPQNSLLAEDLGPRTQDDIRPDLDAPEGGVFCGTVNVGPPEGDARVDAHPFGKLSGWVDDHPETPVMQDATWPKFHRPRDLGSQQLEQEVSQPPQYRPGAGIQQECVKIRFHCRYYTVGRGG